MKLGPLRAAIRAEKNVAVPTYGMTVLVQKGSLLDALGRAFESKASETGMSLVDGLLRFEAGGGVGRDPRQIDLEDAIAATPPKVDYDDLL